MVSELVHAGTEGFGLEAGSKPELMAVLAMARPGSIVICNGYKDREYIRLALIGKKLGLRVHIVIEKLSELDHVFAEAKALEVEPLLGVRVRLASIGAGKWQNTGGDKGKFGLSPSQVLTLVERLDAAGLKHTLKLQHFHMGSQISNVRDIANGMREATRYFVELSRMGVPLEIVDVGGGLGVDYEGSRSRSHNSINYSIEQYAATIVQSLGEAVAAEGLPAPHILTEAGRAMTAHHAVLVVDVSEVESVPAGAIAPPQRGRTGGAAPPARSACRAGRAPAAGAVSRGAAPPRRGPGAVCAGPARAGRPRAAGRAVLRHRQRGARAPAAGRARAPAGAGRAGREAGRQVLRQLLGVRVGAGHLGDRADLPDHADRAAGRGADPARRDRRPHLRFGRPHRSLRRRRGRRRQPAAACAEGRRELLPGPVHGRRLPGDAGRHPQPVRRYRRGERAGRGRALRVRAQASRRHHRPDARLRRLRPRGIARAATASGSLPRASRATRAEQLFASLDAGLTAYTYLGAGDVADAN